VIVRGTVVETRGPEEGATEHIHKLAKKYTGAERYEFRRDGEARVILRIKPTHVFERGTGT
jgi:hypothetical protein